MNKSYKNKFIRKIYRERDIKLIEDKSEINKHNIDIYFKRFSNMPSVTDKELPF